LTDQKSAPASPKTPRAVPLAIIGIGCMFPKSKSLREYWATIKNGVDTITEIPETHWSPEEYFDHDPRKPDFAYAKRGGFIDPVDFDPLAYGIPPNVIEATDTSQLLGMVAAAEALKDAGYDRSRAFDRDRVSVVLGVTGTLELVIPLGARLGHPIWRRSLREAGVDEHVAEDVVNRIADAYVPWQENSFPGLLGNVVAGRIANRTRPRRHELRDRRRVRELALGDSPRGNGARERPLGHGRHRRRRHVQRHLHVHVLLEDAGALAERDARPFDAERRRHDPRRGLGMVVLKRLEDAERDGDRVYAVLRALGSSSDGKGEAIYAPSSEGQARRRSVARTSRRASRPTRRAGRGPRHGHEGRRRRRGAALNEIYGAADREGRWCAIGSVKSQIGHTKAAAGVAGLIKAALALHYKVLPPTIKVERPIEDLDDAPLFVNTVQRPWVSSPDHPRRAALSAFGFGGATSIASSRRPIPRSARSTGTETFSCSRSRPATPHH
jgi:acyl transferase domain-containing protein